MLLAAVLTILLSLSIYVRHGGLLHGETDMYLVDHLGDRPYFSKIICPHSLDAVDYMARPLSHVLEHIDAHFVYWSYLAGYPHFFSVTTFAFLTVITFMLWHFGSVRLKVDRLSLLLIVALFWTSPNFFFAGCCFRTAKVSAAFFLFVGMYALLGKMVRTDGDGITRLAEPQAAKGTTLLFFLAALAACLSDPQGVAMVLLLSGVTLVWALALRSRSTGTAAFAGFIACGVHSVFNFWLGPLLVRKLCGFETSHVYPKFQGVDPHSEMWKYLKQGASVCCDLLSFICGNMPKWMFCVLLAGMIVALFMLRPTIEPRRGGGGLKHPGILMGMTVVLLFLGNWAMYSAMIARHPPLAWEDVRRSGYYPLPLTVFLFMTFPVLFKLSRDRFRFSKAAVCLILAALLLFNIESLPDHYRAQRVGHLAGYILTTPYLLTELKKLRDEKPTQGPSREYDVHRSSQLAEVWNMLRNPLGDLKASGTVDVQAYLKSSRYLNFLKSKKRLEFLQPSEAQEHKSENEKGRRKTISLRVPSVSQ